jgi:energy-coupling factor transporter ATP-binding protein EcfA2
MTTTKKATKRMAGIEVPAERPEPVPEGLTVIELYVENIKKVRLCHLKPQSDMVLISGPNGSGKTSVLDALTWALDGLGTTTTEPIRKGQRVGTVKVDLGDYIVTRHFTRVDPEKSQKGNTYFPKLTIEGKNNEIFKNPQTLLNSFMGHISFDPLAFTRMADKEQLQELRRLVKFDIDIDALDAAQAADYEERKIAGRVFDTAKIKLENAPAPAADLPAVAIDTAAISKRIQDAVNHNSRVEGLNRERARLSEVIETSKTVAAEMRNDAHRLLAEAEAIDGQVAGISIVSAPEGADSKISKLTAERDALPMLQLIDTAALTDELTKATATNTAIADAAAYRTLQADFEAAEKTWKELDTRIKERAAEREAAIARAEMPIEGLGVGDGEVLFEGLPFSQASNAAQIRVSMALGMASNPKLRIMIIKDGSLLDANALQLIQEMAAKNGFQVWIERVDTSGKVGVVMEDGEASGEGVIVPAEK